jgi:mRNA interferase RelE/StbE
MHEVLLSERARKQYDAVAAPLRSRFDRCFETLSADPRRHPNIRPLKGPLAGLWRFRVGDYRVVYRIQDDDRVVIVLLIAHRRDVYE